MSNVNALTIWKRYHWVFFTDIQGLIICLERFFEAVQSSDFENARLELSTAIILMKASGAAMQLAGSFTRCEYESDVRSQMTPPNVQSDNFSGLMSWDHACLMTLWKKLQPIFRNMPVQLKLEHQEFISAYKDLAIGHKSVCEKFGGGDSPSLRSKKTALDELERFAKTRVQIIEPKEKHPSSH